MDAAHAAQNRAILHYGMSGNHGCIRHDHMVAHDAVVRNMRAGHQQAVAADARFLSRACRAMDARILANRRAVADDRVALLTFELQILRLRTDRSELEYTAVLADARPAVDHGMRLDARPRTDLNIRINHGMRADLYILGQCHMIADDGIRSDFHTLGHMRLGAYDRRLVYISYNLVVYHFSHPLFLPERVDRTDNEIIPEFSRHHNCRIVDINHHIPYSPAIPVFFCLSYFAKKRQFPG